MRVPKALLPKEYEQDIKLLITYNREKIPLKKANILRLEAEKKVAYDRINILKEALKSIEAYI